jgi:hypothetical protein
LDTPAVPAGWRACAQSAINARIAVPSNWTPYPDQAGEVACRDPATGASALVRRVPGAPHGLLAAPLRAEAAHRPAGYHRIRLVATSLGGAPAASWEFQFREGPSRMHAADLQVVVAGAAYMVEVRSPEASWQRTEPLVQPIWESLAVDG